MDAFYAAVEAQRNPALRDRPLVVGADPKEGHGRGVVTAASYAARRYGIRSALPISRAWRLAEAARRRGEPETIFVRDDHALYREVSARIMAILAAAGDAFQKTSVDEAYLELSSLGSFDAAVDRARRLKAEIVSQEGLTASVGIGPNKLVAKIASDFQKPDGLTVVRPEEVQPFLDPLRIRVIPGIGPKTERFLHERHIRAVADLRTLERAQLAEWFGRELRQVERPEIGDGPDVTLVQETLGLGSDPRNDPDPQRIEKRLDLLRSHDREPVGLLKIGGDLGDELVGSYAHRGGQPFLAHDLRLEPEIGRASCRERV